MLSVYEIINMKFLHILCTIYVKAHKLFQRDMHLGLQVWEGCFNQALYKDIRTSLGSYFLSSLFEPRDNP